MASLDDINKAYPTANIGLNDIGGSSMDFAKTADQPIGDAFNQYVMAQRAQAKPLDLYTKMENDAGIPQLRQTAGGIQEQVGNIEDALHKVEPTVNATSENSLMTEGQRQNMIVAQRHPLLNQLDPLSTSLGRVLSHIDQSRADIGQKVGLAMQGNQMELEPAKMRINLMQDRAARLQTGFNADREARLNILMDKLHSQQHLNDREFQEASQLAQEERGYQARMQQIEATYKSLGRYGSINQGTGQIIGGPNSYSGQSSGLIVPIDNNSNLNSSTAPRNYSIASDGNDPGGNFSHLLRK